MVFFFQFDNCSKIKNPLNNTPPSLLLNFLCQNIGHTKQRGISFKGAYDRASHNAMGQHASPPAAPLTLRTEIIQENPTVKDGGILWFQDLSRAVVWPGGLAGRGGGHSPQRYGGHSRFAVKSIPRLGVWQSSLVGLMASRILKTWKIFTPSGEFFS